MKEVATKKQNKIGKLFGRAYAAMATMALVASEASMQVLAFGNENVTVTSGNIDAAAFMGKIIGILLSVTRYVGVAMIIYGVYEIVMSFMQNQPEAKTKGIIMAIAGVIMVALKTVLASLGVIS